MHKPTDLSDVIGAGDVSALIDALEGIAKELNHLGMRHADTALGAIEFLGLQVKDGLDGIAESNRRIAEALEDVAKALSARTDDDDD